MHTLRRSAWLFATAAVIAAGTSHAALAEDQGAALSATASTEDEVIVTAQRRATNLQQTPIAVTALSSQALTQANIATTQDLMQVVPSLQVSTQTAADGGGSASFFLRGMGQQRSGNGSGPAVGVYVDDFYYPSLEGSVFDIVDLSSVEVLRGPQGTLFGRNTIGGAIRYTSKQPDLGAFEGHASATYGSYNRTDLVGVLNVPVGDDAALRLTLGHLERDGYVRAQSNGRDAGATETNLARVQFRVEPTDRISINLAALWNKFELAGFSYNLQGPLTPVPGPTLPYVYNSVIAPLLSLPLYTDALRANCFYCQPGASSPEFSTTEYVNLAATVSWDIAPWLTLKSLSGWQHLDTDSAADLDGTPINIFYTGSRNQEEEVFSQEFQFNGHVLDDRLNFVSGLFYYQDNQPPLRQTSPGVILAGPGSVLTPQDQKTEAYAGYVDATYQATEQLSFLAGYRYSEDHKTTRIAAPSGALNLSKTFPSNTWRAGVQYRWTPDVMTYFTASTGFRAGGFNPYQAAINTAPAFDPEEVTSYEAGARLQFLDHRLTVNPTAFYYDWDKIQVQAVYFPPSSTTGVVVLQNAGAAVGKGFELEWNYQPVHGLHLFGTLATLDLHYTSIGSATGITLNSPLQRAPKLTYSIGASYTHELQSGDNLAASLNYGYEAKQNSTPTDADTLVLPAYNLLSGRLEWTAADGRLSIALFGANLTDEHYYVGGVNYYSNVGAAHYDLGRPREIGLTLRGSF